MRKFIIYIVILATLGHYAAACAESSIKSAQLKQLETIQEI